VCFIKGLQKAVAWDCTSKKTKTSQPFATAINATTSETYSNMFKWKIKLKHQMNVQG